MSPAARRRSSRSLDSECTNCVRTGQMQGGRPSASTRRSRTPLLRTRCGASQERQREAESPPGAEGSEGAKDHRRLFFAFDASARLARASSEEARTRDAQGAEVLVSRAEYDRECDRLLRRFAATDSRENVNNSTRQISAEISAFVSQFWRDEWYGSQRKGLP